MNHPRTLGSLHAYAVHGGNMDSVCDGVGALHRFPGFVPVAVFALVAFDVSYGSRVEDDLSSLKRVDSRGFWKPLIIANEHAYTSVSGFVRLVTRVSGFKIVFFIEEGVIGNVDFAVYPQDFSVCVNRDGGVVELAV